MAFAVLALALLVSLILSGCFGDGDQDVDGTTGTDRELLARASAVLEARFGELATPDVLAYADLAAAREQLELPEDASFPGSGGRRLLASFAARPLFLFEPGFWSRPSLGPLGEVLDSGAIEAAVGTSFAFSGPLASQITPGDALVVRTRQPFEEIAARLRSQEGYQETAGGLLVDDEPIDPDDPRWTDLYDGFPFPAAGGTSGGVVVLGGSRRAVRVALRGPEAELTPGAELLSELSGAARVATGRGERECVVAVGLGEDAEPRAGEFVVLVDEEARAGALELGGLRYEGIADQTEVRFAKPTAEGERVVARFSSTDDLNATRLAGEDVGDPYLCAEGNGGSSRG